jgi:hypothetical protein
MANNKKASKKSIGDAIAILVFVILMTLIGGFSGYNIGIRHSTQPLKPEPFTINGYTSESDFDAVFAQITWDRLDAENGNVRNYMMGLNHRMAELEDSNKSMKSEIGKLELNITYLINVLGHNGIQVDVQCLNNGRVTEPCNK